MKALLVDDIEINHLVGRGLLGRAGYEVDVAENGQAAIEALKNSDYDIIFMDLQMPVMDGYTASIKIRALNERCKKIPIIAVSANTTAEDIKKCHDSGINEHISKPIDQVILNAVLEKYLGQVPEINTESEQQINAVTEMQIDGIDAVQGLRRMAGNRRTYIEVLDRFNDIYSHAHEKISECLRQNDTDQIIMLLHSMKGSSGNIGAEELYKLSGEAEQVLRQDNTDVFQLMLPVLEKELCRITGGIKKFAETEAERSDVKIAVSPDEQDLESALKQIMYLLENDIAQAEEAIRGLNIQLEAADLIAEKESIFLAMQSYDIQSAKNIVASLLNKY